MELFQYFWSRDSRCGWAAPCGGYQKIVDALDTSPGYELILGVRDFDSVGVPVRSLIGNKITSWFFNLLFRIRCPDTQTGLRGIPKTMFGMALLTEGKRFEYEMNMLENAARKYNLSFIPITTVYDNQQKQKSHFRPVRDSILIYGRFFRYSLSSVFSTLVDIALFALLSVFFQGYHQQIPIATCCARVLSGCLNYTLNRKWSFKSRKPVRVEAFRYAILFVTIMACSAVGTTVLNTFISHAVISKMMVDVVLFFIIATIKKRVTLDSGCITESGDE